MFSLGKYLFPKAHRWEQRRNMQTLWIVVLGGLLVAAALVLFLLVINQLVRVGP
jgi:hypothetical protein